MLKSQNIILSPENGQRQSDWTKAERVYDKTKSEVAAKGVCAIYIADAKWSEDKVNTFVIAFPCRSPKGSVVSEQVTALNQLEWYKKVQTHWCEHNASITVTTRPEEWFEVGNWVYKNWDVVNGVSFCPPDDIMKYEQTPYETITKDRYDELMKDFKKIDYSQLSKFELEDATQGAQALACQGGVCELLP
jgi:ribonucleoside-diphosphate reductase alpha chain